MCLFKTPSPSQPIIQYVGPSQEQIDSQNAALDSFKDTLTTNNQAFQTSLQSSIDAANAQSATLLQQITTMRGQTAAAQSAGGGGDAYSSAPYALTTEEGAGNTDLAQTTEEITAKKKPKGSLKITKGALTSAAGAGVNYGV